MRKYKWKDGKNRKIAAQSVGDELDKIKLEDGYLHPVNIVEKARSEGSILHDFFEWDDSIAAENFRKKQAYDLIRIIMVDDGAEPETHAYYCVTSTHDDIPSEYVTNEVLITNEFLLNDAIRRMRAEFSGAKKALEEILSLVKKRSQKKSVNEALNKLSEAEMSASKL